MFESVFFQLFIHTVVLILILMVLFIVTNEISIILKDLSRSISINKVMYNDTKINICV